MAKTFAPPLSGTVIATIIDAFDLRRWDKKSALSSRNARRYLGGVRVSHDAQTEVIGAFASSVLASKLFPPVLSLERMVPPDDPLRRPGQAVPPLVALTRFITIYAEQWDVVAGALRTKTAPVAFERIAYGACFRLVVIDLAVRLCALLWLARWAGDDLPLFWIEEGGAAKWLRGLLDGCTPKLTRDGLAMATKVHIRTVDGWLDADARPEDENIEDIAEALAAHSAGQRKDLLGRLRLAYGMRHLFKVIERLVGGPQARFLAKRLVGYPMIMLEMPRHSRCSLEELDRSMLLLLVTGTVARGAQANPTVASLLKPVCRNEPDAVWRTTIKAVTGSWLEYLQEVTAKLAPSLEQEWRATGIEMLTPDFLEQIAYGTQATKEERDQGALHALATAALMEEGGRAAGVEYKIRAVEAFQRGDKLGAVDLMKVATRHDPLDAENHFRLGAMLWQIGAFDEGLRELEVSVRLKPDWDRSRVEIGILLLNQDREAEAVERLEASKAALSQPSPWLLVNLGVAYERVGESQQAIDTLEEMLLLTPDDAEALDRVAHLHFNAGEKRKGAERAKQAAHLGFTTVFSAWKDGHYDGPGAKPRPRHTVPEHAVHFRDPPLREPS
jgi:tetratricopeptide (TPR) repeat protein